MIPLQTRRIPTLGSYKTKRPILKEAWDVGLNSPPPKSAHKHCNVGMDHAEWPGWAICKTLQSHPEGCGMAYNLQGLGKGGLE